MPHTLFSIAVALLAFWISYQHVYPRFFNTSEDVGVSGFSLEQTIREIKLELVRISATPGDTAGLVLSDVNVELLTQNDSKGEFSGGLTVPVLKASSLEGKSALMLSQGSKMTLSFDAPSGTELLAAPAMSQLDLSELVLNARNALISTQAEGPELIPKSVQIEVSFVFVKDKSTSTGIKAHVVSIGSTSSVTETGANKITLKYANPLYTKKNKEAAEETKVIPPK